MHPETGVWLEAFSDGAGGFTHAGGRWDPGWSVAVTYVNGNGFADLILSRADGTWVQATVTGPGRSPTLPATGVRRGPCSRAVPVIAEIGYPVCRSA